MIMGPVTDNMGTYDATANDEMQIMMAIHEVSHVLLEGTESLAAVGAISNESKVLL